MTRGWFGIILIFCFISNTSFALLPFPLTAGQRGMVTCLDNPSINYDVYLPPNYTTNSTAFPIIYTFSPNGGGYVSQFQSVCASLQIIAIGVVSPKNGESWDVILRDIHAVTRDVRQRVLFDPTAEIMAGFSGGAVVSYASSRFRPQHVAGVYAMNGWMGRGSSVYPPVDQVQTNLLVARSTGDADLASLQLLTPDSNYLASCGAVIKDWYFAGGHTSAPDSSKTPALQWILANRITGAPSDRLFSLHKIASWRSRLLAGEQQAVMGEAVSNLVHRPRSWWSYQAQLILDEMMTNSTFRSLDFSNLAQGHFINNHFYFSARGAALNSHWQTYHASLKALTGISGPMADRSGGIYTMLQAYSYPAPLLQCFQSPEQLNVSLTKDAPSLTYSLQSCTNLFNDSWHDTAVSAVETNTAWSADFVLSPELDTAFYRMRIVPTPTTNSAWP